MGQIYIHPKQQITIDIDESGMYCTSLPCHTCKKIVALSAHSCPHCGEIDLFCFQAYHDLCAMIKKKIFRNFGIAAIILLFIFFPASIILWIMLGVCSKWLFKKFDNGRTACFINSQEKYFQANHMDYKTWKHYINFIECVVREN